MAQITKIKYPNGKLSRNWYSDFTYKGKRIHRSLKTPFKEEAKLMLPDLVRSIRGLRPGETYDMSWALFQTKYLEWSAANKAKDTAEYKDKRAFALVNQYSNIKKLREMTPELLESLRIKWAEHHIKKSTITRTVKAIKTAMRRAEDLKYIPLQNWRIVKVDEPARREQHYSLSQFEKLLKICPPAWKMATMLQGRGGLRSGEAYILRWPDVDFESRRLHIYSRPGWRIKGDKKGNAEKWVPIEPDLYEFLKIRRKKEGFLIEVSGYGNRMSPAWFLTQFSKYIKQAGLKGPPHTLRHTCASMMINNGATLEEVGGILGHKSRKSTEVYTHLLPATMERAISRLPKLSR